MKSTDDGWHANLEQLVRSSKWFMSALTQVQSLQLPCWCIGAGAVRNLVWDHLHGYGKPSALPDLDVASWPEYATSVGIMLLLAAFFCEAAFAERFACLRRMTSGAFILWTRCSASSRSLSLIVTVLVSTDSRMVDSLNCSDDGSVRLIMHSRMLRISQPVS